MPEQLDLDHSSILNSSFIVTAFSLKMTALLSIQSITPKYGMLSTCHTLSYTLSVSFSPNSLISPMGADGDMYTCLVLFAIHGILHGKYMDKYSFVTCTFASTHSMKWTQITAIFG